MDETDPLLEAAAQLAAVTKLVEALLTDRLSDLDERRAKALKDGFLGIVAVDKGASALAVRASKRVAEIVDRAVEHSAELRRQKADKGWAADA